MTRDMRKSIIKKKVEKKGSTSTYKTGQVIDKYKGVKVYYNGSFKNVFGRNISEDGYNLGLKYQCVEFAKRFFYEAYNHKMPDSYGNAKDFFDHKLAHGQFNKARGMIQYYNGKNEKPRKDDLVILGSTPGNIYGHCIILTRVGQDFVEFIQQNPGNGNPSRAQYKLLNNKGVWLIDSADVLGFLRI